MTNKIKEHVVLTLDAGGTNFEFSAIKGGKTITDILSAPSNAHDLEKCIHTLISGFEQVMTQLDEKPSAISFAFPGPADYGAGIIGDTPNLPAFRGGVPLGPILEAHFKLPVFINNDGDLFAYGEAMAGFLPALNQKAKAFGLNKQFNNLIGITLGTGVGCGLVTGGVLHRGDNSAPAEIWLTGNRYTPDENAEEGIGTQSIINNYNKLSGTQNTGLMPFDIYKIAKGTTPGNAEAAIKTFELLGRNLGEVLANLITIYDGMVVIGGGISGAREYYKPTLMQELNGHYTYPNGTTRHRLVQKVYNFDDENQQRSFFKPTVKQIKIPGTDKTVDYRPEKQVAVAHSQVGAGNAISQGAYYYAIQQLKNN